MENRRRVNKDAEVEADFSLLEEVLHFLEIKDTHHLSASCLVDILYTRKAFSEEVPHEWPTSFLDVVNLLKRTGYVDPGSNMFRICAGRDHVTIFYPEGSIIFSNSCLHCNNYFT